jgi:hypothetical protein
MITFAEFIPISRGALLNAVGADVPLFVLEFVFLVDLVALFVSMRLRLAAAERSRHERLSIGIALRFPLSSGLSAAGVLRITARPSSLFPISQN